MNDYADSDKEVMFVFIKPHCSGCALYKDSIVDLYKKFGHKINFIGLCNPQYWDNEYLKQFGFKFVEADNELRKSLHLAITPQFILTEKQRVTFSNSFNKKHQDEYRRLKQYLETKYPR